MFGALAVAFACGEMLNYSAGELDYFWRGLCLEPFGAHPPRYHFDRLREVIQRRQKQADEGNAKSPRTIDLCQCNPVIRWSRF